MYVTARVYTSLVQEHASFFFCMHCNFHVNNLECSLLKFSHIFRRFKEFFSMRFTVRISNNLKSDFTYVCFFYQISTIDSCDVDTTFFCLTATRFVRRLKNNAFSFCLYVCMYVYVQCTFKYAHTYSFCLFVLHIVIQVTLLNIYARQKLTEFPRNVIIASLVCLR